jgi:hypothetical protein
LGVASLKKSNANLIHIIGTLTAATRSNIMKMSKYSQPWLTMDMAQIEMFDKVVEQLSSSDKDLCEILEEMEIMNQKVEHEDRFDGFNAAICILRVIASTPTPKKLHEMERL